MEIAKLRREVALLKAVLYAGQRAAGASADEARAKVDDVFTDTRLTEAEAQQRDGLGQALPHAPFAVMAGAPWNVLDSRGVRVAICGGDSNRDWETHGPAIAAAIVEALNAGTARKAENAAGPISSERMTLDELLVQLEKWKTILSGQTCVSFESLCVGSSSLWHQTHRENFRKIDRKPEALSRWVLEQTGSVQDDFPAQVLGLLQAMAGKLQRAQDLLSGK